MSSTLVVCPHCGARRGSVGPSAKMSNDEIRALLLTEPTLRGSQPSHGLLQTLVLPHPSTDGAWRIAELVLTVLSLPLVVAGVVSFGISKKLRRAAAATRGELAPVIAMTVFGGIGLWSTLAFSSIPGAVTHVVLAGTIAALWARGIIRARSARAQAG